MDYCWQGEVGLVFTNKDPRDPPPVCTTDCPPEPCTGADCPDKDKKESGVDPVFVELDKSAGAEKTVRKGEIEVTPKGEPVLLSSGDLLQTYVDFPASATHPLSLERTYRSTDSHASSIGRNWEHNFDENLVIVDNQHRDGSFPQWCYEFQPLITCVYHNRGDGGGDLYLMDPTRPIGTYLPEWGNNGVLRFHDTFRDRYADIVIPALFALR
ncbi:MAG: hypothetical protein COW42_13100 [Deltaproteobacteria bacterium CG17_big_fil_post_rev_8_21_14_2_50_63_7]|nr:MAG: hypothetical protein COW42_13100 [Deltaproteobacteria bacterium CG17_big_fil_post_rev_8_21_14_2_50_63_7]